jgi:hypothetical protein
MVLDRSLRGRPVVNPMPTPSRFVSARTLLACLALALSIPSRAHSQSAPSRAPAAVDRATFFRRLAAVQREMTRAQVRALLGAPDDVLTRMDPELEPTNIVTEQWSYGASQHGAFASLGAVAFTDRGAVFSTHGTSAPAPVDGVSEPALRALHAQLAAVPGLEGHSFDPRPLVAAVNALHPLGKPRALAVITEYLRVVSPWTRARTDGVFLVLRALFDPPAGSAHPVMHVGAPDLAPPADPLVLPAFPLVIVDEVPLLLVGGYMLGGLPEAPSAHLAWYRANGVLRRGPLRPTPAQVASVITRFEASPAGAALGAARASLRPMLSEQARRMQTAVPQIPRAQRVRWDYARRGLAIELLLERIPGDEVRYWVHVTRRGPGPAVTGGALSIAALDGGQRRVLRAVALTAGAVDTYQSGTLSLAPGRGIIASASHAGAVTDSPTLAP